MAVRDSDRLVTPRVICVALGCGTVLVLAAIGAMVYLTEQGLDPNPMLRLVSQVATGVGMLGTLLLQITSTARTAKVEREFGRHATAVERVVEVIDAERGRHSAGQENGPAPARGAESAKTPAATRESPVGGRPVPVVRAMSPTDAADHTRDTRYPLRDTSPRPG